MRDRLSLSVSASGGNLLTFCCWDELERVSPSIQEPVAGHLIDDLSPLFHRGAADGAGMIVVEEGLLREIAGKHLLPFFSGSRLEERSMASTSREDLVAFRDPVSIAFKVSKTDDYRLVVRRSQPFAKAEGTAVPEISVVRAFVDAVAPMADALSSDLKHDLLSTFSRRVVAKAMSAADGWEETILTAIDQLSNWSSRTYEGSAIAAALGFRHKPENGTPFLSDIASHDFAAVLSNGHDTLLEFDFAGRFISHAALKTPATSQTFAPIRLAAVAEWTTGDKHRRRVAVVLNRGGEILVLRDGFLLFAKRGGSWSFLTHEPVITQMGTPHDVRVRHSVYETALDASFARSGACIGVVNSNMAQQFSKVVVNVDDHLIGSSVKAQTLRQMIKGKKFFELDRRLRQEIVAIDGATVLSHDGSLLAAGAILKIPGGSSSGGRLAAARALSTLGLGVKVSQDGGIRGYRTGDQDPAFQVM